MDYKPLIYFCSLTNNSSIESSPLFANINDSINFPFTSAYQIRLNEYKDYIIKTIWYDFARESFIYNEIYLQNLNTIINEDSYLDFLYILDYGLLVWIVNKNVSYLIKDKGVVIDSFTKIDKKKEWFVKKSILQIEYCKTKVAPKLQLWKAFIANFTKHYYYRYSIFFEKFNSKENTWSTIEDNNITHKFSHIEQILFDGTHDKLHDGGLLKYHNAGKPKKLAIKWHIKKAEYAAYFWFEDEQICSIFERFYGAHPETKTDFIIRIDAENKKYELALYRQGLKEPQIIPEDAYQLIVFKNKFEDYRSENYNQERGAWIW